MIYLIWTIDINNSDKKKGHTSSKKNRISTSILIQKMSKEKSIINIANALPGKVISEIKWYQ